MVKLRRKFVLLRLAVIAASLISSLSAVGAGGFESEFFAPIELTKTIEARPSVDALTDMQKAELSAAKRVIADFPMALGKADKDPLTYLTPALRKKYKTRMALYKEEFGDEAYISAKIFDFQVDSKQGKIQLRLFLTGTKEGTECTNQRQFTLKKSVQIWKIDHL